MNLWGKKIELICNFISFVQWECLIKVQWSCETVAMNGAWHKGRCPNISCSLMERHSKAVLFSITLYGLNCEIMHRHHDWNGEKDEEKKNQNSSTDEKWRLRGKSFSVSLWIHNSQALLSRGRRLQPSLPLTCPSNSSADTVGAQMKCCWRCNINVTSHCSRRNCKNLQTFKR